MLNAMACPTDRFRKILLSTDTSEFSEGAIREAINLAKKCSGKLHVISVVETNPEFEALAPQVVEKAENETRIHLESVKARASKDGVDCETIVHQGEEPYQFIVDEAEKKQVDTIVVGRRGRKGFMRLMMGSVTAKVIGHAPCNVLVVPRAGKVECSRILIATDGSKYSNAAAEEAVKIAKTCGSSLVAVSAIFPDVDAACAEDSIRTVKDLADKNGVSVETNAIPGRHYEVITETAKNKNADLIVLGSYGKTGLKRLLMGSVTERVIGHAECAVLVVKSHD